MKVKKNNRFNSIFSTLTESERKEFCEFLRLSFVKKPRLSEIVIDKLESGDELHSYLVDKYSERSLWNIYFELTRSIKQFIALKEIMDNETEMHKLKRLQFLKRNLNKLLENDHKSNIKNLKSAEFSFNTLKEIYLSSNECSVIMIQKGLSEELSKMLEFAADHHVLNFYYELVSYLIEKEIRNEFYSDKTEFLMQDLVQLIDLRRVMKLLTDKYPEYKIFFSILFNIYSATKEPGDIKHLEAAKDLFLKNISLFAADLKSDTYYSLLNLCTFISKKTGQNLDSEMFEILNSKLANGITDDLMNAKIGENHFRDYVYIALNLNEDKWAEEFIKKYSPLLPDALRENNRNTALAFLNLHRKKHKEAINHILKLKRKFYIHDLDYYTIQIFAHYETDDLVECLRVKKRFQEYINKNSQFPASQKKGAGNFLRLLSDLIKYNETGKKQLLDDVEYSVMNTDELFWRKWIKRMVEQARLERNK